MAVLTQVCLPGIDGRVPVAELAARIGAQAVPDPWSGDKFIADPPAMTWSLPRTPRAFFWLARSDLAPEVMECTWLSFDGRRSAMARAARDAFLRHARDHGLGEPVYEVAPLERLEQDGFIHLHWRGRGYGASISLDRTDSAATGLRISVHADAPEATAAPATVSAPR